MKTREQIALELVRMCSSERQPVLSSDDLLALVDESRRGLLWEPNTAYQVDDIVFPATRNGRIYVCVGAGTTGATEPSWTTNPYKGKLQTDGTCEWADDGTAWLERYDVKRAAWRGWLLKAQRCTEYADSKDESVDIKMNQLYDNCMKTAERYRPYNIY